MNLSHSKSEKLDKNVLSFQKDFKNKGHEKKALVIGFNNRKSHL